METLDFCAEVVCFLAVVQAGPECLHCEEGCSKARPPGCPHPCVLPCHPGECPPCVQMLRIKCHCKITSLYVECRWVDSRKIHIVLKLFEWCLGLFLNPTFCRVFSFVFLSFSSLSFSVVIWEEEVQITLPSTCFTLLLTKEILFSIWGFYVRRFFFFYEKSYMSALKARETL